MNKVTLLPKQVELTTAYLDKLNTIADDLEDRAEALRRYALEIRRHALTLEAAAERQAGTRRRRPRDYKIAEPIR